MTGNGCTASEPPPVREWANRPITSAKEWREYLEAYQEETRRRTKELKFGFSPLPFRPHPPLISTAIYIGKMHLIQSRREY